MFIRSYSIDDLTIVFHIYNGKILSIKQKGEQYDGVTVSRQHESVKKMVIIIILKKRLPKFSLSHSLIDW